MAKKEMWKVVGAGPERLRLANGDTVVVSRLSDPFEPARDSLFRSLKDTGRLKMVMVDDGLDDPVESPEPFEPEDETSEPEVEEASEETKAVEIDEEEDVVIGDTEDASWPEPDVAPLLVSDLGLTSRIESALLESGVDTVEALSELSAEELLLIDGIGEGSIRDIDDALRQMDLSLRIDE